MLRFIVQALLILVQVFLILLMILIPGAFTAIAVYSFFKHKKKKGESKNAQQKL